MIGKAICETLTNDPAVCATFESFVVVDQSEKSNVIRIIITYFYVMTVGLIIMVLVCIYIARRAAKHDVNEEVKRSVANYFSVKETDSLK